MIQRDLLKDQIEQAGKVLARMIDLFFHYKSEGNILEGIQNLQTSLESELNINLENWLGLGPENLYKELESSLLNDASLENISELVLEIGRMKVDKELSIQYFTLALSILNFVSDRSQLFSISRQQKLNGIDNLISEFKNKKTPL